MSLSVAEELIEVVDEVEDGLVLGFVVGLREPSVIKVGVMGMDLAKPIKITDGDGGKACLWKEESGEGVRERQEGPGFWGDFEEVDGYGIFVDLQVVLTDQQIDVVMGRGREGRDDLGLGAFVTIIGVDLTEGAVIKGVEVDGLHRTEGIVPDLDLVTAKLGIDCIEEAFYADVGEDLVDCSDLLEEEVGPDPGQVDRSEGCEARGVAILRGLKGLGVDSRVIADSQPRRKGTVELVDVERLASPDLGFELSLNGLEETFNEAAWSRITWRPMKEFAMNGEAGRLEAV